MRAIIGPNGAGKTTMMDVVTGKTRPDAGDVYFDRRYDLTKLDEAEIAELGIGRKFQKPTVFDIHTVEDNLAAGAQGRSPRARARLFWRRQPRRSSGASTSILDTSGSSRAHRASPAACRTARSNGSRSACCWRRSRSCFWSTSRSPA